MKSNMIDERIEWLYGRHGAECISMYQSRGEEMSRHAWSLLTRNEFEAANRAADKAREYREAAWLLSLKNAGAGI